MTGVYPLRHTGVCVDAPGHLGLTQLLVEAGWTHVNLPRPQGLHEDVAEDTLVTVAWGQVEQDDVSGPSIFEHSVLTDPFLTELPDLLL